MRVPVPSTSFGWLLGLAVAAAGAALPVNLPDLTGTWQLNQGASDDPQEKMKEAGPATGSSSGGGHHGGRHGGGGGGMSRGGGGDSSGRADGAGEDTQKDRFAAMQRLTIRHQEPQLVIADATGRERTVYTDGRKTEEEHSYGGTTKVQARWKDGHIEIASNPEHGPKITETYAVTADGSQLTITTKLEGGRRRDVTIRRVYDAVKPQTAPPPAAAPAPAPSQSEQSQAPASER